MDQRQAKTQELLHRFLRQHHPPEILLSHRPLLVHFENAFRLVEYQYHFANYLSCLSVVDQHLYRYVFQYSH